VAGKDPDWVKVYVHGEYGYVRDGKPVYPEFKDSVHVAEFEVTDKLPLYIGVDFGLTPAATIAQRTALGQWRVHSELVTEDMGAVRFSEVLRRVMNERYKGFTFPKITGDPAGDVRAQTDEVTPFQILRKAGIPAQPAATNDFIKRRESVAGVVSRLIDGAPGLIVHPRARCCGRRWRAVTHSNVCGSQARRSTGTCRTRTTTPTWGNHYSTCWWAGAKHGSW
jgi:hypothetical protein